MRFFSIPLLFLLAACTGVPEGVTPVSNFDSKRYLGTWYEIMRLDHSFERGMDNVTATYSMNEDGTIVVINRGLKRESCEWEQADGKARFLGDRNVGSLGVTFQWPFEGGYHVMALDEEAYSYALVSGPDRGYLWLLARTPELDASVSALLVDMARELGFPVDELITVDHSAPPC